MHYSGFINIVGKPNVGKSTLMNALVGERMSIITHKPQTTRHRIMGILSGEDFQMVFSDTPGIIYNTRYKMQEIMNQYAFSTREDADILLYVTTQKPIILGKGGSMIKKLGIASRKSIEKFLDSKVHLELYVKVKKDWRDNERTLKHFGYGQ